MKTLRLLAVCGLLAATLAGAVDAPRPNIVIIDANDTIWAILVSTGRNPPLITDHDHGPHKSKSYTHKFLPPNLGIDNVYR